MLRICAWSTDTAALSVPEPADAERIQHLRMATMVAIWTNPLQFVAEK